MGKRIDFGNDTSKNIFSHPYIYYMASKRLQGGKQFHSKNHLGNALLSCQNAFEKSATKT